MSIADECPSDAAGAVRPAVRLIFPPWAVAIIAAVIVLPWLAIGFLLAPGSKVLRNSKYSEARGSGDQAAASPGAAAAMPGMASVSDAAPTEPPQVWVAGKKGPWGQIESMLFAIDVPDESVAVVTPPANEPPIRWNFPGYSKEKVLATLRAAGMPEDEVKRLDGSGKWSSDAGLTAVEPGDKLILDLTAEVRAKLYSSLVAFPQNAGQIDPVYFRSGDVDWRLQDSGLAPASIALLKRLLYPQGKDALLFADLQPALRSLPSDAEQRRFMKVIARKRAVMARLRVGPETDVEELAQYWGLGGRRKDIAPFLDGLHRVEKGCTISLVQLLPSFARDRLYRYPAAADDKGIPQDCFWSAFNFFNESLDNNAEDTHSLAGLNKGYYRLSAPTQLGDMLILTTHDGVPVHAAVFLADDIYFTKNGVSSNQPWILTRLADVLEYYNVQHPGSTLNTYYFRRKGI